MSSSRKKKSIENAPPLTDERIIKRIQEKVSENRLTCVVAHLIAADFSLPPATIGAYADQMEIKLTKCQLGLFGHTPAEKKVTPKPSDIASLEKSIQTQSENQKIACLDVWRIADDHGVARLAVSCACEAQGIKIITCQLGAF